MKKVRRIVKRVRSKVLHHELDSNRAYARVFLLRPDYAYPHVVELRIGRTRRHMRAEIMRLEGRQQDCETMGMVRSFTHLAYKRSVVRPGLIVARMYLNSDDLRAKPGEIVSHECTHAGMAWARYRKANLKVMPGEEVLCYAVGVMVAQVNHIGYVFGVWK